MKKYLVKIGISFFKAFLSIWYACCKIRPVARKVVFLSREADQPTLDFQMLEQELLREDPTVQIVMRCHKMKKGLRENLISLSCLLGDIRELATAQVAVCDTYSIAVSTLHHRKELTVLQIWHALGAVKKFGKQILDKGEGSSSLIADSMGMHKNYDYVYCTSSVTSGFYAEAFGVPQSIIKVRGMPRVDYIRDDHPEMVRRFQERYPDFHQKPIILYLPTFRKGGHPDLESLLNELDLETYQLIIRLHPLDSYPVPQQFQVDASFSTYDLMEIADLIVSDYSAASIEASILGKPVYFYVYDLDQYQTARGLNVNLNAEMSHAVTSSARELARMIREDSYDYDQLQRFCNRYVETKDQPNTRQIASDILSWISPCK